MYAQWYTDANTPKAIFIERTLGYLNTESGNEYEIRECIRKTQTTPPVQIKEVHIMGANNLFPELKENKDLSEYSGIMVNEEFYFVHHENEHINIFRPHSLRRRGITLETVLEIFKYLQRAVPSVGYECLESYN